MWGQLMHSPRMAPTIARMWGRRESTHFGHSQRTEVSLFMTKEYPLDLDQSPTFPIAGTIFTSQHRLHSTGMLGISSRFVFAAAMATSMHYFYAFPNTVSSGLF
jgi:hypothetical protein